MSEKREPAYTPAEVARSRAKMTVIAIPLLFRGAMPASQMPARMPKAAAERRAIAMIRAASQV